MADVVDGEDGARGRKRAVPGEHRAKQEGQKPCLPVVRVNDVRPKPQALADEKSRPGKEREPEVLVMVGRVDPVAPIEPRAMNKIDGDVRLGELALEDGKRDARSP